ncbi:hypothetical protein L6164_032255 [Bauhinia variegata]|uniref:Uncharacterized protein n=1 Tax=Bauhinia variegata TaxID=167791 RepID=A0ACB9KN19_BAUVA|nr:hypothetical protein L6164_032255 [Bauhinia variegata]
MFMTKGMNIEESVAILGAHTLRVGHCLNIVRRLGLFGIDSRISKDFRTAPFVKQFAMDQNYFFQVFSSAFVKLSSTNVLTAQQGEVRRQCNRVN